MVVVLVVYISTLSVKSGLLKQRKVLLEYRLRREEMDKRALISKSQLTLGLAELERKKLFVEWVGTLPPHMSALQGRILYVCKYDFRDLLFMEENALYSVLYNDPVLRPYSEYLHTSIINMKRYAYAVKEKVV